MKIRLTFLLVVIGCGKVFAQGDSPSLGKEYIATDKSVDAFYKSVESSDYSAFYKSIIDARRQFDWNDWLTFKMLEKSASLRFPEISESFQTLLCWYSLGKMGFDVRLAYDDNWFLLFVYTEEGISSNNLIRRNGRRYMCLNVNDDLDIGKIKFASLIMNPDGARFSFKIDRIPMIPEEDTIRFEKFFYDSLVTDKFLVFKIRINETLFKMYGSYPNVGLETLFNTPLSQGAYQNLVPVFRQILQGKDILTSARFIHNFVRDAYLYIDDLSPDSFGRDKWQVPEEALGNSYLDSEDRAGLFYCLVKEILDLPMVILKYEDCERVNVGISLDDYGKKGDLSYKGKTFLICDPSTSDLELSEEITRQVFGKSSYFKTCQYKILGEYFPSK